MQEYSEGSGSTWEDKYGDPRIVAGAEVIIGKHRDMGMGENWTSAMNSLCGKRYRIDTRAYEAECSGFDLPVPRACPLFFRRRDMVFLDEEKKRVLKDLHVLVRETATCCHKLYLRRVIKASDETVDWLCKIRVLAPDRDSFHYNHDRIEELQTAINAGPEELETKAETQDQETEPEETRKEQKVNQRAQKAIREMREILRQLYAAAKTVEGLPLPSEILMAKARCALAESRNIPEEKRDDADKFRLALEESLSIKYPEDRIQNWEMCHDMKKVLIKQSGKLYGHFTYDEKTVKAYKDELSKLQSKPQQPNTTHNIDTISDFINSPCGIVGERRR